MINILFCGNKKVFDGALTQLISITNRTDETIRCYIFTMDVSRINKEFVSITDEQIKFLDEFVKSRKKENSVIKIDVTDLYEKEFGKTPVTQLVRKLVGLDRNAANEAFSEFLNNDSFNSKQIHFVKLIVDYVVKNGFIEDNRVLMEDPFRTVGGIIDLFENHVEERNKLIMTINEIKRNALEIS